MTEDNASTCFVLTPFKEPFDSYFVRLIKPAIEECGLYAIRGDSLFRPSTIMDDIWSGIRSSRILIAELTERNPNVFYELGLAHALSKPAILISESMDDVPFDLRSIRVIVYSKDDPDWGSDLRRSLVLSIRETLENPHASIPSTFKTAVSISPPEESEVLLRLDRLEQQIQRILPEGATEQTFINRPESEDTLVIGDIVIHKKFGKGTVLKLDGAGNGARVQVNFEDFGVKWLVPKYAGLQIVTRMPKN